MGSIFINHRSPNVSCVSHRNYVRSARKMTSVRTPCSGHCTTFSLSTQHYTTQTLYTHISNVYIFELHNEQASIPLYMSRLIWLVEHENSQSGLLYYTTSVITPFALHTLTDSPPISRSTLSTYTEMSRGSRASGRVDGQSNEDYGTREGDRRPEEKPIVTPISLSS